MVFLLVWNRQAIYADVIAISVPRLVIPREFRANTVNGRQKRRQIATRTAADFAID
jgi:hypothetical protein